MRQRKASLERLLLGRGRRKGGQSAVEEKLLLMYAFAHSKKIII